MLRVDDEGVLIIDNTDYNVVDVSDFRPNVDITLTVLEGTIAVDWPLDAIYSAGDSETFQVEFPDDRVRIYNYSDGVARVLLAYPTEAPVVTDIYSQPAIVPAAVSSELDNHGEERIHIAPYIEQEIPEVCAYMYVEYGYNGGDLVTLDSLANTENLPAWFEWGEPFAVTFTDQPGAVYEFNYDEEYDHYYAYRDNGSFWWPTPGLVTNGQISPVTEGGYSWSCLHVEEEPGV